MKSAYNYTIVERHKQKVFIPYIGLEFTGWTMLLCMLAGVMAGVLIIGTPLSFLMGDFGYIFSLGLTAIIETIAVTLLTEIDHEVGKSRLQTIYFTSVKNYKIIYDEHGRRHYLSKRKEGRLFYVC